MKRTYRYDAELDMLYEVGGNANFFEEEKPRAPGVIGDGLPGGVSGMRSHADGRMYDSKSRYTAEVKARGFSIVGNEEQKPTKPKAPDYAAEVVKAEAQIQGDWQGTRGWLEKQNERRGR